MFIAAIDLNIEFIPQRINDWKKSGYHLEKLGEGSEAAINWKLHVP